MGFGQTIDINGTVPHSGHCSNGHMTFLCISQFRVDFIRNNIQIVCNNDIHQFFQITALHNRTCRIIRKWKYKNLCLRCDRCFQFISGQSELIFCFQFNDHRNTACQSCTWQIRYIAWLWNQYFIPRIQHGTHCNIDGLASANSNHDLMVIIIIQTVFPVQEIGNLNF